MTVAKGALAHLAVAGSEIALRVRPGARQETITIGTDPLIVHVTAPPADGKANAAVRALLARALAVPKSRLELVRGAKSRDKVFRLL